MIILSPEQMVSTEKRAAMQGVSIMTLMENASERICDAAWRLAAGGTVVFLCGQGNNGGDGYGAARLYHRRGGKAVVASFGDTGRLGKEAKRNWQEAVALGLSGSWQDCSPALIVDALFGTGLTRAPQGEFAEAIDWINEQQVPVLSVDIPSGVDARGGSVPGAAVQAAYTVVFHAYKTGNVMPPGRFLCGQMEVCPIGIPPACEEEGIGQTLCNREAAALFPPRPKDAHKGVFGHALLVAGSRGMAGAAALCTQGALYMGAGLVTTACCADSVLPVVQTLAPSAMCIPLAEQDGAIAPHCGDTLRQCMAGKQCIAIGPGLTRSHGAKEALRAAIGADVPLVIDADALNLLSEDLLLLSRRKAPTVLTPHPGEMARLQKRAVADPMADALELAKDTGAVVLLKGASTVIASPQGHLAVNLSGTPAMARGGSGDVLTGFIAALLSQGLDAFDAARLGAYLHGLCGEEAQSHHSFAMTASDLPLALGAVLKRILPNE